MLKLSEHYRHFEMSRWVYFSGVETSGEKSNETLKEKIRAEGQGQEALTHTEAGKKTELESRTSLDEAQDELDDAQDGTRLNRIKFWADRREFRKELRALNERFFNKKELGDDFDYWKKALDFQERMKTRTFSKLKLLHQKGGSSEEIQAYKKDLSRTYEFYSKIDGNSKTIGHEDLRVMNEVAFPTAKEAHLFLNTSTDNLDKRLEMMATLNPEGWEDSIDTFGNVIINQAVNDGREAEFIQQVSQIEPAKNFRQAKAVFKDHLEDVSIMGPKATREFLAKFNGELFKPTIQYEINIEPKSLETQVRAQLGYLDSGVIVPFLEEDKAVVDFVRADREERNRILTNKPTRELLFRGIALTKTYREKFDAQSGNLPAEAKDLRYNPRIENPTSHDQAAQLQALIIRGQQAEAIVSQYNNLPENAGKDLTKKMSEVKPPEDSNQVVLGLKFKAPDVGTVRYTSAAERGGINSTNLILMSVEAVALLAVLSNTAQSYADASGDNFAEKLFNSLEQAVSNPALIASAAAAVGAHMAQRNVAFQKYGSLNEAERKQAGLIYKLDNLSARVGKKNKDQFIGSQGEWRTIDRLERDQITELLDMGNKMAIKNGEKYPQITREMLVDAGVLDPEKDADIFNTMASGPKASRTRYLFYQKFFSGDPKPVTSLVKQLITGKGAIPEDSTTKST